MSPSQTIPLDSPRWHTLRTRRGEGAVWVSDTIEGLRAEPDTDAFYTLWPELCSEEHTYDAAYAAAPYLAQIAHSNAQSGNSEYLIALGLIATYAVEEIPADLAPGYEWARRTGLTLTLQRLAEAPPDHELRYLLSAVAAYRGRADLASALQDLDAIQEPCPTCGAVVFPSELQHITQSDLRSSRGQPTSE